VFALLRWHPAGVQSNFHDIRTERHRHADPLVDEWDNATAQSSAATPAGQSFLKAARA